MSKKNYINPSDDPNYSEELFVGNLYLDPYDKYVTEDRQGDIVGKKMSCSVWVYSNEGPVPHCHIYDSTMKLICCVCLDKPMYFDHNLPFRRLNSKERKELNEWFSSQKFGAEFKITNWQSCCLFWNSVKNNIHCKFPKEQPNYRAMTQTTKGN